MRFDLRMMLFEDANPEGIASALEKAASTIREEADKNVPIEKIIVHHHRPFGACFRMDYGVNDKRLTDHE